ncbi:hypothetical protein [Leptolyngbya iicbica]|uniref:Phycobilisome protein n=2 Tax=Cyanophyceae TaxID=3028117 RepID=A0A4Q7E8B2_9CYAN|nr:hypothetical protein [Leptolyngbya sp. LK]RZM78594.1 hypothetical protein DYY88_07225 [Leptolyngbya sp. LK]
MNPKLEALFDEPEKGYLQADELNALSQFVSSLPERINFYQRLRNEEVTLMQSVADALQKQFPQESEEKLKRSLQNGILMVRYAAMAMLTDDIDMVTKRLEGWLPEIVEAYNTQAIDIALYQLIKTQFAGRFSPAQMALLTPGLDAAERLIAGGQLNDESAEAITSESLIGLF